MKFQKVPIAENDMAVFNFDTRQFDYVDLGKLSADQMVAYIPLIAGGMARNIYQCHLNLGADPLHAYLYALQACIGTSDIGDITPTTRK